MAVCVRQALPAVKPAITEHLYRHPQRYDFIQIMRLLQVVWSTAGQQDNIQHHEAAASIRPLLMDKLLVRPALSLACPATEVVSLEKPSAEQQRDQLTTTFLGLYGASSPIPTFYTETLLSEAADGYSAARRLFDLINQPFYHHYFAAWGKYQLLQSLADPAIKERLFSLVGRAQPDAQLDEQLAWDTLRFAGLFNQLPRSAVGLQALVEDFLAGHAAQVRLQQCVRHWADIPSKQRLQLGCQACRLGNDSYLGTTIIDKVSLFRIHLSIQTRPVFLQLQSGGTLYQRLIRLIHYYLIDGITVELVITPGPAVVLSPGLGNQAGCVLGDDLWLGGYFATVSPIIRRLN